MGNVHWRAEDAAHVASVARDICPFPNYNPSTLFADMLLVNSSLHLRNHYTAVQSSLTPMQLEDFTQDLRTTFGREGKVTLGGVGVVALSLAVLFDTLAKKVRGEWVPELGPIPGLFVKNPRGYYPPHVYTASEYLRLVPYIANNPTRMIEQTEWYLKQLVTEDKSLDKLGENHKLLLNEDITALNVFLGRAFAVSLKFHLLRIKNITDNEYLLSERTPPADMVFHLNCDPEAADKEFLAEVQKSDNHTQEAFKRCKPKGDIPTTWLQHFAHLVWLDALYMPMYEIDKHDDLLIAQRGDFDLKAHAFRKWVE
ncbi:uncharacterized protein LOC121951076 [Plectropomus leopardus]|uniref:uncharacterized protein LOC121951076 n=1 Tax=Plectropomus leopardus TaxID=160734 RepID=UPI001C4D141C|nr:uncharacterized protein LOC121951076 [Plectropomus leopardus]